MPHPFHKTTENVPRQPKVSWDVLAGQRTKEAPAPPQISGVRVPRSRLRLNVVVELDWHRNRRSVARWEFACQIHATSHRTRASS